MVYSLELPRAEYERLLAHARACLPQEACGLVGGTEAGEGQQALGRIERVYLLENIDHSPEHFGMAPAEQLAAVKDIRAHGWRLLGNWHSHPQTPSRPSEEDKRLAHDPSCAYLILSLADGTRPVLKAFHVSREKEVSRVPLAIVDDEEA